MKILVGVKNEGKIKVMTKLTYDNFETEIIEIINNLNKSGPSINLNWETEINEEQNYKTIRIQNIDNYQFLKIKIRKCPATMEIFNYLIGYIVYNGWLELNPKDSINELNYSEQIIPYLQAGDIIPMLKPMLRNDENLTYPVFVNYILKTHPEIFPLSWDVWDENDIYSTPEYIFEKTGKTFEKWLQWNQSYYDYYECPVCESKLTTEELAKKCCQIDSKNRGFKFSVVKPEQNVLPTIPEKQNINVNYIPPQNRIDLKINYKINWIY